MATVPQTSSDIESSKRQGERWDWICRFPISHLSFLLRQCMPVFCIAKSMIERNKDRISKEFQRQFNDDQLEALLSGSSVEGLSLPPFAAVRDIRSAFKAVSDFRAALEMTSFDLDVMLIAKQRPVASEGTQLKQGVRFFIESHDTHPGYLRLRYADSTLGSAEYKVPKCGTSAYYLAGKMSEDLLEGIIAAGPEDGKEFSLHGPAVTIEERNKLKNYSTDADFVFALPCPDWPDEALEWIDRHRLSGWPPLELREKIVAGGCHVVAAAHPKSKNRLIEWRFSFSKGEKTLAENLTDTQRQCYILLKMIHHMELKSPKVLVSYHLKNILLRVCEKIPLNQWREDNIGSCFLVLLDELLHCLITHNIPNYFLPSNNMISHLHEDFVKDLALKVSRIRQNPVEYLFDFHKLYKFGFSPILPMDDIFDKVFKDINDGASDQTQSLMNAFIPGLLNLALLYGKQRLTDFAVETAAQIPKILKEYGQPAPGYVSFLGSLVRHFPDEDRIKYLECVVSKYPADEHIATILGNIGFYLFAEACKQSEKSKKDELQSKAESYFQTASSMQNFCPAGRVNYANFLYRTGNLKMAVSQLESILCEMNSEVTSVNTYDQYDLLTLDENLQNEIAVAGHIEVPSVIMACYLLVKCFKIESENENVESENIARVIQKFRMECENVNDVSKKALCLSLYGYSLMTLQDYEQSVESFTRALKLNPGYQLAALNVNIATNLLN